MTLSGMITLGIVFVMFFSLVIGKIEADLIMFTALVSLMVLGILTPIEAFSGFSNEATLTVGALFVVVYSIKNTELIRKLPKYLIGKNTSSRKAIFRIMIPVAGISAFINNTPVVVMLTPLIRRWAEKIGIPETKLLIPLSYAAIMGGMCTLIGTSTNIVLSSMLMEQTGQGFSMFELAIIGIPCTLIGIIYMIFVGHRLLPNNKGDHRIREESSREYLVEMKINSTCPFIGKTVQQANLRNLTGVYLMAIIRNGKNLFPISGNQTLHLNDSLIFTGDLSTIIELEKVQGLSLVFDSNVSIDYFQNDEIGLAEVVVSKQSLLCNKTIKEIDFRTRYHSVIIAVFRNGKRIVSKIGSITLKPGDVLLALSEKKDLKEFQNTKDFYVITCSAKPLEQNSNKKSLISLVIFFFMIVTVGVGLIKMITAAFLAIITLLLTKCISLEEAKKSVQWNILIMIGSSLGIANALEKTGGAGYIAEMITTYVMTFGPIAILAVLFLLTWIATETLTNNAAAAIIFPIAYSIAEQMSLNPMPFAITVAIAASTSFSTPIGYQTNLIVYGTGGYKFSDFFKVGLPLSLIFMVVSIILIPYFWPLK